MRRGALRFAILKLLAGGARHGYDLLREMRERGWGMPGPASVYPVLTMLEEAGFVKRRDEGDRRIYELTPEGREFLHEHADRVNEILADLCQRAREQDSGSESRQAMRQSAERLMRTVSQVELSENQQTQTRVQEIMDRARKEIYALLAEE
ncbi:MAG: PadR family transcriptional regulator [Candidatus Eremiobacteraeota bacterium]|nr:PadR family transcriptional regulator [Candidatus Eremiobacteraeota bacterium]